MILCHLELAGALVHQREGLKDLGILGIHLPGQFEIALGVFPVTHTDILPGECHTLVQRSVGVRGHLCPAAVLRDTTDHQAQQNQKRTTAEDAAAVTLCRAAQAGATL